MSKSRRRVPKYRHYKPKNLGVVRIDGTDRYLGRYNSPESLEKYHRLIAEWLSSPPEPDTPPPTEGIVQIQTEVRDATAVQAACRRLGLPAAEQGTVKLFSGEATGLAVKLPEWKYPVVCNTTSGQLKYDNFEGRWGDQSRLGQFLQMYAVERAKIEARRKGHSVTEQALPDGSIKLTVQVAGGAA